MKTQGGAEVSFGIRLPGLVPAYAATLTALPQLVVEFERIGFDDVIDGEHLLFKPEMHHPGGSGNLNHGRSAQQSDRCDSLVLFAVIAAKTSRIRLCSSVILGAAHNFAVLARQAATLDVLSSGRFSLGVGAGWFAGEFEAMGIPPSERAARLEETVRACRELWSPGLSSFKGDYISFADVIAEPAPVTPGGVDIWWGGNAQAPAVARRIVTLSDGWLSREAADYDEIAESLDAIRAACVDHGRNPAELGARASLTASGEWNAASSFEDLIARSVDRARRLAAIGVTHLTLPLSYYGIDLEQLAQLLAALRSD